MFIINACVYKTYILVALCYVALALPPRHQHPHPRCFHFKYIVTVFRGYKHVNLWFSRIRYVPRSFITTNLILHACMLQKMHYSKSDILVNCCLVFECPAQYLLSTSVCLYEQWTSGAINSVCYYTAWEPYSNKSLTLSFSCLVCLHGC